jgi:HK97 family phage portal protein
MGFVSRVMEKRSTVDLAHPRDPVLAQWFGSLSQTASGVNVTADNARSCPEVDACVRLTEDTVATIPLDLFERTGDGQRERRDDHALHQLLHDQPNSWQTSAEFRQMMEGWRVTWGNAYAIINWRGDGIPQSLEPVHPTEMWPFRTPSGEVAYRWTPLNGPMRILMQMEVLHLKDSPFCRFNPMRGESRVERHREAIGRAMATGEYLSRFFSNNAVPKAFIEVPGKIDKDQAELIRDMFEQRHAGLANAHRIGILQGGFKINAVGIDNDKAQAVESYQLAVTQLARVWGIPLHMIGEISKDTSWGTGIEQQSIGFVVYCMRPKLVAWEQALNAALMSSKMRKQFYFEFNVDGLLRGDFKTRMEGYALLIQWGLATPNEIRRQMNLPPVAGGDDRLQPLNMAPASRIMDVLLRDPGKASRSDAADEATRLLVEILNAARGQMRIAA